MHVPPQHGARRTDDDCLEHGAPPVVARMDQTELGTGLAFFAFAISGVGWRQALPSLGSPTEQIRRERRLRDAEGGSHFCSHGSRCTIGRRRSRGPNEQRREPWGIGASPWFARKSEIPSGESALIGQKTEIDMRPDLMFSRNPHTTAVHETFARLDYPFPLSEGRLHHDPYIRGWRKRGFASSPRATSARPVPCLTS